MGFSDRDQHTARAAIRVRVLSGDNPARAVGEIAKLFGAEWRPYEDGFLIRR